MLKYILAIFLLGCCVFGTIRARAADSWDAADIQREATYQVLSAVDWGQTLDIANHSGYHEQNAILGLHPSTGKINTYFAATSLLHAGIAYMLPPELRTPFEYVTIGIEFGAVANNASIGLHVKF